MEFWAQQFISYQFHSGEADPFSKIIGRLACVGRGHQKSSILAVVLEDVTPLPWRPVVIGCWK